MQGQVVCWVAVRAPVPIVLATVGSQFVIQVNDGSSLNAFAPSNSWMIGYKL